MNHLHTQTDTKKFSIIHVPLMSFFSEALYRDVGLHWKGTGFAYLLLLLAVCWITPMVGIHVAFSDFAANDAPPVIEQVPRITITDGEVSIDEPQPYYIKEPESGSVLAIIDTTGTVVSLQDANTVCVLTKTRLIARKSEFETRTFDLSQVENFVLDSNRIMGWLDTTRRLLVVIMYPFALFGSYVYRIIQALIYALVGLLFAKWCNTALSYQALIRLAVVAVTPAIIISTVLSAAHVRLPYAGLFYLAVALGYLFYGVRACSYTPVTPQDIHFPHQTEF
ncbi:MAG: DUF1189 family protein [Planctomycetota bacterium]|jgi:hypothetical protein